MGLTTTFPPSLAPAGLSLGAAGEILWPLPCRRWEQTTLLA